MNDSQREEEGHRLMTEAEKLLNTRTGIFRIFSSSGSKEEAAETFVRAANSFKLCKAWALSGKAFERAAEVYSTISDQTYEAASKWSDAGKAYKNVDSSKAIVPFQNAIEHYAQSARFQQCARLQKDLGELYENDLRDQKAALDAYIKAADYYDMDDSKSNANTMRLKTASLTALNGNYAEAAETFEAVAQAALNNNLLKYGAREHLLRAGLCRLCISDMVGAQRAVETYSSMDPSFPSSREGRLLQDILESVEQGDAEAFTNHVFEYDSVSKLDEWKTTILLKIKKDIKAAEEDLT